MRPRGQTPRMHEKSRIIHLDRPELRFNEAAGADPADASTSRNIPNRTMRFNEAAGADPADAPPRPRPRRTPTPSLQ